MQLRCFVKICTKLTGRKLKHQEIQMCVIKYFRKKVMSLYDEYFPIKIIKLKTKDIQIPWITTGIKKSSKYKQCLYEKFLKTRCKIAKNASKNYKNLFEQFKKTCQKTSFL